MTTVGVIAWQVENEQEKQVGLLRSKLEKAEAIEGRQPFSRNQQGVENAEDKIAGRSALRAFEDFLMPHDDIPTIVQELLSIAEDEKLLIVRGEYRPQKDAAGKFLRYHMAIPVKGSASAINRFMKSALRRQKNLAIEEIQFKRDRIESDDIEAHIRWVVFSRLPEEGVEFHKSFGNQERDAL